MMIHNPAEGLYPIRTFVKFSLVDVDESPLNWGDGRYITEFLDGN